ncbi:hypothetical protein B0H15DRAFT_324788 [Mycena belliarum]|uniref:C2 domain-containing protein n=1 Tax=Mycena belliarum TaxID=1033014 RepID=A0AAD6UKS1_9AGAR|nr:hypothetical protein B0H15DRAFT_324788 [Mycena belliae]
MISFISSVSRYCGSRSEDELDATLEATGALKIVIQSAHIGGARSRWKRPPKPFVSVKVSDSQAETGAQAETYDPSWIAQTFFLLVKSQKEQLRIILYDHKTYGKPEILGAAAIDISRLIKSGIVLDAQLPVLKESKQKGDLLCSLFYYPVSISPSNGNGLLAFAEAHSRCVKAIAKIRLNLESDAPSIHVTPRRKINNGSVEWESMREFLCFDKNTCVMYIDVFDSHLDEQLGHLSICLTDLVEATLAKRGPWPLSGSAIGKLVASAEWRPLDYTPSEQ